MKAPPVLASCRRPGPNLETFHTRRHRSHAAEAEGIARSPRNPDAADDLVQATCERALRSIGQFRAGTRLDSWMFRIMRNLWIDGHRKSAREETADEDLANAVGEDGRRKRA
jgi:RNA polymerase sigma factor (sigma-70 family)